MTLEKWLVLAQNNGVIDALFFRVMETPGGLYRASPSLLGQTPLLGHSELPFGVIRLAHFRSMRTASSS